MEIRTHVDINTPPEHVWSVLINVEQHAVWNPYIRDIQGEIKQGAQLVVRLGCANRHKLTFKPIVVRVEPGRALSWRGTKYTGWMLRAEHHFRLESLGKNRTRFHQCGTFQGLLVQLFMRRLNTEIRQGFKRMNSALKSEAQRIPI